MIKYKVLAGSIIAAGAMIVSAQAAHAAPYVPQIGDLIKIQTNPTVFLVDDTTERIAVTAEAYKIRYNNNFSLVKTVTEAELAGVAIGLKIGATGSHKDGTLIIYNTDHATIYVLENGFKRAFSTEAAFLAGGYNKRPIEWVGTYEIYPSGPNIK